MIANYMGNNKKFLFNKAANALKQAGTTKGYTGGWNFVLMLGRRLVPCGQSKARAVDAIVAYYRRNKWDESILDAPLARKVGVAVLANETTQTPKPKTAWREQAIEFYASREWQVLRYEALRINGGACQLCGRSRKDGVVIHVDHVLPRWTHPHLSLDLTNLQVLCADCNLGKGAKYSDDWR